MLKNAFFWAAVAVLTAATFLFFPFLRMYFSCRAFVFITAYTLVLVIVRYPPGRCIHRISVLSGAHRHLPVELSKAGEFLAYVCTRLLFAGLIFTLLEVASALALDKDLIRASGALAAALLASLYSLVLYLVVYRARRQTLASAASPDGR